MNARRVLVCVGVVLALLGRPAPVLAQKGVCPALTPGDTLPASTPLACAIPQLYLRELLIFALIAQDLGSLPVSFEDLEDALILTSALNNQLSTFPLGSSAGGFSWTFDTSTGAFIRASPSFGPLFAERALTVGRKKLNLGVNYQRATYDEFEGQRLRDRDIKFHIPFTDSRGSLFAYAEDSLSLKIAVDTVGIFANYGLTDRLDVGIAIPIVRVDFDADLRSITRLPGGERFGSEFFSRSGQRTESGIGDVVLRAKYNVLRHPGGGVAAGLDLRLPTGDEEALLGIPGTQAKLFGIWSGAIGRVSPHANVGYTFSQGNEATRADDLFVIQGGNIQLRPFLEPPDEINYTTGVDVAVHPRITVVGDFIGRTLRNVDRIKIVDVGFGPNLTEFDSIGTRSLSLLLSTVGVKWNLASNLLVSAHLLFPVTRTGLRDKFTPVIGVDWSF